MTAADRKKLEDAKKADEAEAKEREKQVKLAEQQAKEQFFSEFK